MVKQRARLQVPLGGGRLPAARGAPHRLGDRRRSRPTRSAQRAVELALEGHNAVMPTIERISDAPYRYQIGMAPLADVANVEKFMPRDFITDDGFGITEACKRYLRPLIQGEDYPAYRDGLPVYATLKNVAVARKLAPLRDLASGTIPVLFAWRAFCPPVFPDPLPRRETTRRRPIPSDLRLLIEVVARACKRISQAVNKGALGGVLGTRRHRERAGRGAEEARRHRQRGAARGQRMGRPPGRDGVARKWKASTWSPTATRRANTCCCSIRSTARRTSTSTSRIGTIFSRAALPEGGARRERAGLPAAGHASRSRPATASTARRPRWC